MRTPVVAVTALAWVLVVLADSPWAGHGAHSAGVVVLPGPHSSTGSGTGLAIGWALMLTAMMAPLLIPALRHVHARSLRNRRRRAVLLVTVAAAATWSVGSAALLGLAAALGSIAGRPDVALLLGLAVALAWQASPLKQHCLNRHCARPPLAVFGAAADRDVLRFGVTHAAWCLGSCWALMLVPLLAPWHLPVMLIVSLWMWVEPFDRPVRPSWRVRLPMRSLRIAGAAVRRVA
jgi:predicted metal-binding membrane protein